MTSKASPKTHRASLLVFKIVAVKEPMVSIGQEVRQPLAYKPHLTATTAKKKKKIGVKPTACFEHMQCRTREREREATLRSSNDAPLLVD